jgi:uncharacterized membrane protein YhaH (DUF805 family)
MKQLLLIGRLVFGAWMLINGANHFFFTLWPVPSGHEPLAVQLMAALVHSRLFDVAMAIQLVSGALILAGVLVPVALCVVMPITTCALYWALILDHQPIGSLVAVLAFALNGLLLFAYIERFSGVLQRHSRSIGEATSDRGATFDTLFASPGGRTSRQHFIPALVTLFAAVAFFAFLVKGLTAQWCLFVLLVPGVVLHARRLRDMGSSPWLLLVPVALLLAAFVIWLRIGSFGAQLDVAVRTAALVVAAGFALWGCTGGTKGAISPTDQSLRTG